MVVWLNPDILQIVQIYVFDFYLTYNASVLVRDRLSSCKMGALNQLAWIKIEFYFPTRWWLKWAWQNEQSRSELPGSLSQYFLSSIVISYPAGKIEEKVNAPYPRTYQDIVIVCISRTSTQWHGYTLLNGGLWNVISKGKKITVKGRRESQTRGGKYL